jgi:tyrosinase-like protein
MKDKLKVEAFKRGVAAMKARRPSDPTSWFFQAAIHGVSDEYINEASRRDSGIARVDRKFWNQCTHFRNASSAEFLIWHRAYLYYFERILRTASGDQNFSLPYWNYADPSQRECPAIFADPDRDPRSRNPRNPLYDGRRDPSFMNNLARLSDDTVGVAESVQRNAFFAPLAVSAFGGATNDQAPNSRGRIEMQPHDQIHGAVGGIMGDPYTAAFDPLFWVHHSNIDRLWNLWDCLKGSVWGVRPRQPWLDAKPWWFVDTDGSVKNLPRSSYLSTRTLGIAFDDEPPGCKPVSSTPLNGSESGTGPVLLNAVRESPVVGEGRGFALSATSPRSTTVAVTAARVLGNSTGRELLSASVPQRRVLLQISGVDYDSMPSVGFGVFVNLPPGAQPLRSSPYYVGNLSLFGIKHEGHMHDAGAGQIFEITEISRVAGFDASAIRVDIIPFDLLTQKSGGTLPQRSGNAVIDKFQVLVVDNLPEDQR